MVLVLFFSSLSQAHDITFFLKKRLHMGARPCDGLDGMDCQIGFVCSLIYSILLVSQVSNMTLKVPSDRHTKL